MAWHVDKRDDGKIEVTRTGTYTSITYVLEEPEASQLADDLLWHVREERESLSVENDRLKNLLYETTSLRDWLQAGYTIEDYNAFNDTYNESEGD